VYGHIASGGGDWSKNFLTFNSCGFGIDKRGNFVRIFELSFVGEFFVIFGA
jgi:hypothetical protein